MRLKTKVVLIIAGLLLFVSITGSIINYMKNVHDTQEQLQNTSYPFLLITSTLRFNSA